MVTIIKDDQEKFCSENFLIGPLAKCRNV